MQLTTYIENQLLQELNKLNEAIDTLIKKGKSYKHLAREHRTLIELLK